MIRHFTHQLFSYGFVAYKQCTSLNFAFRLFLKDAMSHHVARSYSFGNLSNLIREFHARILKCQIVNSWSHVRDLQLAGTRLLNGLGKIMYRFSQG